MTGLDAIIRSGVEAWNAATATAQGVVTFEAFVGPSDALGDDGAYADPIPLRCHILRDPASDPTSTGDAQKTLATLGFLSPIPPNGSPHRQSEPIDPRDRFTLPDGSSGPITEIAGGYVDPATGVPYLTQVTLGVG